MKRNTVQRTLTMEAVRHLGNHATAEEIYTEVANVHPTISRGTVYRLLHDLAKNGDVLQIPVAEGADHFDHQCHPHCHAQCRVCGRVFDIDADPNPLASIVDAHGFHVSGCDLIYRGVCASCAALNPQNEHMKGN